MSTFGSGQMQGAGDTQDTHGTPVDTYIVSLSPANQAAVQHVYDVARALAPEVGQTVYYGMPCLQYKGKGLVCVMATKSGLSLYPFSSVEAVISIAELGGFETTKGSIHFSLENPLPDATLRAIITARMQRIDAHS